MSHMSQLTIKTIARKWTIDRDMSIVVIGAGWSDCKCCSGAHRWRSGWWPMAQPPRTYPCHWMTGDWITRTAFYTRGPDHPIDIDTVHLQEQVWSIKNWRCELFADFLDSISSAISGTLHLTSRSSLPEGNFWTRIWAFLDILTAKNLFNTFYVTLVRIRIRNKANDCVF